MGAPMQQAAGTALAARRFTRLERTLAQPTGGERLGERLLPTPRGPPSMSAWGARSAAIAAAKRRYKGSSQGINSAIAAAPPQSPAATALRATGRIEHDEAPRLARRPFEIGRPHPGEESLVEPLEAVPHPGAGLREPPPRHGRIEIEEEGETGRNPPSTQRSIRAKRAPRPRRARPPDRHRTHR